MMGPPYVECWLVRTGEQNSLGVRAPLHREPASKAGLKECTARAGHWSALSRIQGKLGELGQWRVGGLEEGLSTSMHLAGCWR